MRAIDACLLADEIVPCDVVVVGSGVAGLSAALGLLPRSVTLLTKADLGGGSSSRWAQGGVAAALGDDDSPKQHARDTVIAGAGLGDEERIAVLTREGPDRLRELIDLGSRFDRDEDGQLLLGREGAHGRNRILHAGGDATGKEMVRALVAALRRRPNAKIHEYVFVEDLVVSDNQVVGVLAHHRQGDDWRGRRVFHRASAVVLATGGCGQLYARTTNPLAATGDGLAMAARAGARLADLEFIQFHPTALDVTDDPLPLVTEALRGEGATLHNATGERFMPSVDRRAELAPRDIVARAIREQQQGGKQVFLKATVAVGDRFPKRFPTVWEHCRRHNLDPRKEAIPVTPAAHYSMAGIAVDTSGRTSLQGLWACGEVSSSGVHGANRLASNSLLEALVFGARVAEDIGGLGLSPKISTSEVVWREPAGNGATEVDRGRQSIRRLMWENVGLIRHRRGLEWALLKLEAIARRLPPRPSEAGNLLTLGRLVTAAALVREESRGSHFRSDCLDLDDRFAHRLFWTYRPAAGELPIHSAEPLKIAAREIA